MHPQDSRSGVQVVAERVFRTGKQTLTRDGDRYFVTLKNRTNDTTIEVSEESAALWQIRLTA